MKKIHNFFIKNKYLTDYNSIIINLINLLPTYLYITYNVKYAYYNKNANKYTIALECMDTDTILIIKFYTNIIKKTPSELLYLSKNYKNHYFYSHCFLGYCRYNNFDISIIRCIRADDDIHDLQLNMNTYKILYKDISEELSKMHQNGYVHMDIKTTNIIYIKYGNKIKFGLCDFELVNKNNTYITPMFVRYYRKLYYNNYIPLRYTQNYEKKVLKRLLNLIKINKRIKYYTF
jgi:serine/threonine protein kinase